MNINKYFTDNLQIPINSKQIKYRNTEYVPNLQYWPANALPAATVPTIKVL